MRIRLLIEGTEDVSWEQWVTLAEATERAGLDALFRSDHYGSVFGIPGRAVLDAWTTLAAIAARTERIRLGTLVSPVTFRHPALLAKVVATLDHISGGRVELGLGGGWHEPEHRQHGFPFPPLRDRMSMLEEQLEIVQRLWTEDDVTFEGEHYRLEGCTSLPKPLQRPRPRIIMGGQGRPRAASLAARFADEYNAFLGTTPDGATPHIPTIRKELATACERAGRDPATLPLTAYTLVCIGSDRAEVLERARLILRRFGDESRDPGELLATEGRTWIAGTPDEAVSQLQELEGSGFTTVYLLHLGHEDTGLVDLLGAEVAPAVA